MKKISLLFVIFLAFTSLKAQTVEDFDATFINPEITGTVIFPAPTLLEYAGAKVQAYQDGVPVGPALTISDEGACGIAAYQTNSGSNNLQLVLSKTF